MSLIQEIVTDKGHDSFLLNEPEFLKTLKGFLDSMYEKFKNEKEFKVIAELLPNNTRVLDIGCGDGSLMNLLKVNKNIEVRGLELTKTTFKSV